MSELANSKKSNSKNELRQDLADMPIMNVLQSKILATEILSKFDPIWVNDAQIQKLFALLNIKDSQKRIHEHVSLNFGYFWFITSTKCFDKFKFII